MANPNINDVHVSSALTNVSISFSQSSTAFVHNRVFATVPVENQSNVFYVWNRQDLLRSAAQRRAPGTPAPERDFRIANSPYFCDRDSVAHLIPDPVRRNADPAVNYDASITEMLSQDLMIAKEQRWATAFFGTGIWSGASSSTDMTGQVAPASTSSNFERWDQATSVPVEDVKGEANAIQEKTGRRPNRLVLGPHVYRALTDHPDILDRIKHTQRGVVTAELLAAIFEVDMVEVMQATRHTGVEQGADSFAFVGGSGALLTYASPAPNLQTPSGGYRFAWGPESFVSRFRIDDREGDKIVTEAWYDQRVTSAVLGAFFATCVST